MTCAGLFPLIPALSLRERESIPLRIVESMPSGIFENRRSFPPRPWREGGGEGEGGVQFQNNAAITRPVSRSSVSIRVHPWLLS